MKNVQVNRQRINIEALDDALHSELGTVYNGVSSRKGTIVAHLADSASLAEIARARQLITEHDDTAMSARQQAEQTRRQRLRLARQNYDDDIDLAQFSTVDPLVRQLAQKVLLLTLEIKALRNTEEVT